MDDHYFMRRALAEAQQALAAGEFPVGCVIVHQKRIIASGARSGTRAKHRNEIDHAEMVALRGLDALDADIPHEDLVLYCTMEPCLMCFAALTLSRIGTVVYAYEDVMGGGTKCDFRVLAAPLPGVEATRGRWGPAGRKCRSVPNVFCRSGQ